jgi:hypothetical protein
MVHEEIKWWDNGVARIAPEAAVKFKDRVEARAVQPATTNPVQKAVDDVLDAYPQAGAGATQLGRLVRKLQDAVGHPYNGSDQCDAGEFLGSLL